MDAKMAHHFMAKDFSKAVRNALSKKGVEVIGSQWFPGPNGGERMYQLDNNGEHQIRSYAEVKALVGVGQFE